MVNIIFELGEEFKNCLREFVENEDVSIDCAEMLITEKVYELVCRFLGELYQQKDIEIYENKKERRNDGLVVERRNDSRSVQSLFGTVEYERTYYKKASGGYEYPVDRIAGVGRYERLSEGVSTALVSSAIYESYSHASEEICNGTVSKQTVMNKLRKAVVPETKPLEEKRKVPVLHIDADEDHVALQTGKNTQVKTATVYEGIRNVCVGRNECINAFSISRHGVTSEEFWQQIYKEIDARYSLDDKEKIYMHGDGADWIMEGLSWLPLGTKYVLDHYHVNKYILKAVSGIPEAERSQYRAAIKESFKEKTADNLIEIYKALLSSHPEREETISEGMGYLINNYDAIHIKYEDENAFCGSSEPHVQHTLSHRLSSFPMGWSEETLKHIAPILAAGYFTFDTECATVTDEGKPLSVSEAFRDIRVKKVKQSAGLPDPDKAIFLPTGGYKLTSLGKTLRKLSEI